jgi:AcrR family transcriptional regulator
MPRSAEATRKRILDAAHRLFYRHGFARVALDDIAKDAGVTKRTLYYHVRSKDDLLAAVLTDQYALSLARIREWGDRATGGVDEALDIIFADFARWASKKGWSGVGFTRMAIELADLPGHPARTIARRHKTAVEDWFETLMARDGIPEARERAREIVMLLEGATVKILIHGDRSYAATAASAAKRLVKSR